MKGIEKITARIAADAEAENAAVRQESDQTVAEIRAEYEKQAQELSAAILREGEKENEQRASRVGRTAQLEAKRKVLAMKQEMVSQAFDLAKQKLTSMPEEQYTAFLVRQITQAVSTGSEEVVMNLSDHDRYGAKVVRSANEALTAAGKPGALKLSAEARTMSGGCILRQGDVEVNCTLDLLLELARNELAAQVAEVLFEG